MGRAGSQGTSTDVTRGVPLALATLRRGTQTSSQQNCFVASQEKVQAVLLVILALLTFQWKLKSKAACAGKWCS